MFTLFHFISSPNTKDDSSPIISQSFPLSHKPNFTLPLAPEKSVGSAGSSANSMYINNNILSSEDSSSTSFMTSCSLQRPQPPSKSLIGKISYHFWLTKGHGQLKN